MESGAGGKPWSMAVKAVISNTEGRQLLIKRSAVCRSFHGYWEWPGGKLDAGESFAEGLAREVREECGLEVEFTGLAGASEFEMPQVRVILLCMHARVTGGGLRLSEEHDDSAWMMMDDLTGCKVIPAMMPLIEMVRAHGHPSEAEP